MDTYTESSSQQEVIMDDSLQQQRQQRPVKNEQNETHLHNSEQFFGIEFLKSFLHNNRALIQRKLETFALIYAVSEFFITFFGMIILSLIILFTNYTYLGLLYGLWLYIDRETADKGGRLQQWTRQLTLWKYFTNYFPMTLIKTVDLDPTENYIFGYHPHGIMGYGAFGHFATDGTRFSQIFPGLTSYLVTLKINFLTPFRHDLSLLRGIVNCSKDSINWLLSRMGKKGIVVVIVLGGAIESLDAIPNTMKLTIKNRKGFIKLAIQNGACVVPVISFGENEIFTQTRPSEDSFLRKFQLKVKDLFTFTFPMFHGTGPMGFLPFRRPIYTVVGSPIKLKKNETPSQEEIDSAHNQYMDGLIELFYKNRAKYASDPNLELELQ